MDNLPLWWRPGVGGGFGGEGMVGLLPYISHIGMCRPNGYGFCTFLV